MQSTTDIELSSPSGESIRCKIADTFLSRFMGLMGKPSLPADSGLLIRPCNSIQMFFMRFSIDAIFLSRDFRIVKIIKNLEPGKVVGTIKGAWQVAELPAGSTPASFQEGVVLSNNQS
jgi:uncharacterized protein